MSHYPVGVIVDHPDDIDEVLEPYYEGFEVEPYVYLTRDQVAEEFENIKREIRKGENTHLSEQDRQHIPVSYTHLFPCRTKTSLLDVECPWRGMCWEQEMQKYYDPGTSVRLGDLARNYKTVKDRQRELSNEQKLARMEASSIEKEFDNFFEFLGTDRITSDGLTISRSIIKIPPRLQDGYTYSRYTVRELSLIHISTHP